jgi:hypothetical protein
MSREQFCDKYGTENGEFWDNINGELNEGHDDSQVAAALTRKIMSKRLDLLKKYGPVKVTQAIDSAAEFFGDVDEIGSSDLNAYMQYVEKELGGMGEQAVVEGQDRVDSLVTNGLKRMTGPRWLDAVAAIKAQVGERDYRDRKQFYDVFVQQLVDMYGKKDVAEVVDPTNPRDYEIPAYQRKEKGMPPLHPSDIKDKDNTSPTTQQGLDTLKNKLGIRENKDLTRIKQLLQKI